MTNRPYNNAIDLEQAFPRGANSFLTTPDDVQLGVVVGGSLSKGLAIKLNWDKSVEALAVGSYIVIKGESGQRFFCMITDISLENTNADIEDTPPDIEDPFLRAIYAGTAVYGKLHAQPLLMLSAEDNKPRPVKTIPSHFTRVHQATATDVNNVFGADDDNHFNIGTPLDLEKININLDIDRLIQRSIGVFGKSGTGKSFLTRLLLAGVIKSQKAVALIFDMHNDYGWEAPSENPNARMAAGLQQLLGKGLVSICSLDPKSSRQRQAVVDIELKLPYAEVDPEDLQMLRESLNLSDAMIDAAFMLRKKWGEMWLKQLIEAENDAFQEFEENTAHRVGTLLALQRRVQRFQRWEFFTDRDDGGSVRRIISMLDSGVSVVLEFGRYGNSLDAYILVANYLTRRIHELYVDRKEKAMGEKSEEPRQLLIVIEEAHKFLDPKIANQTIFGIIAREMRKFNVTLLVVDQRPSGIDEEVMSQIGTRITALLDNERDINAVLTGINGAAGLREVLARLDSRQQAIIMGHAVPMPVVIKTRDYDQAFYDEIIHGKQGKRKAAPEGANGGSNGDAAMKMSKPSRRAT